MLDDLTANNKVIELDKQISLLANNQQLMGKEVSEVKEDIKEIKQQLAAIIDKLSSKFATKRVEFAMKWAIVLICGGVISALLSIVISTPK